MKRKIMMTSLALVMCAALTSPVLADSKSACVAIGADNTESQLETVYDYFGIKQGDVEETVVTNEDEREYLDGLVFMFRKPNQVGLKLNHITLIGLLITCMKPL
jgi:uncharacterized protein YpuA (DUF1002 family)